MEQRISMITLGMRDLERARAFYEALGFQEAKASTDTVVFYDMGGFALGLYGWDALAEDAAVSAEGEGFRGVALAYNVRMRDDVAKVLKHAEAAGATIVKQAEDVFWGGHSGYFADPEGHLWEVAWNPHTQLDEDGGFYVV